MHAEKPMLENEELINNLLSLSYRELAKVMHEVASKNRVRENYQGGDFYEYSLVLAEVSWGRNDGINDPEPTITFIGKEHPRVSHVNWEGRYYQGGKCRYCNSLISCAAKVAICPVCDSTVECT